MKSKDYKKRTLRNNGINIGTLFTYNQNVKRILIVGSYVTISVASFFVGRASKETEVNPVIMNTLTERYFDEPEYSGIPYTVKMGDSLLEIVYSYENDKNKAMRDIKFIEEYNDIDSNHIRAGQIIYLVGVPSSKLEDFGYTDNYNYFPLDVEVELRLDFLNKVLNDIANRDDYSESFVSACKKVSEQYRDYKNEYVAGDEAKLDYIVDALRDLSEMAKDYGYSFENNLKALPISEATNYKVDANKYL